MVIIMNVSAKEPRKSVNCQPSFVSESRDMQTATTAARCGRLCYSFIRDFVLDRLHNGMRPYVEGTAWVMLLTAYFAVVNVYGYGVAVLWW